MPLASQPFNPTDIATSGRERDLWVTAEELLAELEADLKAMAN